jgi:hypothetical protein
MYLMINSCGVDMHFNEYCDELGLTPTCVIRYCKYHTHGYNEETDELYVFVTLESSIVDDAKIIDDAIKHGYVPSKSEPIKVVLDNDYSDLPF